MTKPNPRGQDRFSTQKGLKRRKLAPIGVVGDRSPVEYGGGVIYQGPGDEVELHYFQPYDDGTDAVTLSVIDIESDAMSDLDWVNWTGVASYIGMDVDELKGYASSSDPHARASVYESVGMYSGFHELDLEQTESTVAVLDRRYDKDINKAHRAEEQSRMARSTNPGGKHIACGTEITKKECRQLQHVYESARERGYSPERAAKQAWGSLSNPRRTVLMNWGHERARRATNGAGLGGFLGSLVGVVIGLPFGQPLVSVLLSTLGGAAGARYAAQSDRKERATVGGGVGGVFGPIFAALGGYLAGRKPDKRARNPDEGLALPKPRAPTAKRKKNPAATKPKAAKRKSNPGRGPSSGVNAGALAQRLAAGG